MIDVRGSQSLMKFEKAVREIGVPREAITNFLLRGYIPQRKQLEFHAAARLCDNPDGPIDIGFGGARGPGKSTAVFAQVSLDDCQRIPGLSVLFLRKVAKAAREAVSNLRRAVLTKTPHDWKSQAAMIEFPNDSRIILGHFRTDADIDAYLGLEYDLIVIEEDTQLTASKKKDIKTCLRTSKTNWRPRTYRTTNPGGIDHQGFKAEFVEPYRAGNETTTRFIPATVYDNQFINTEYQRILEALTGWKRRAWLLGDWDIVAGQYFSNFDYKSTVIEPFKIPEGVFVWGSLDYGFTHPTACYLYTEMDGDIYVIDEHVEQKKLPEYHAEVLRTRVSNLGRDIEDIPFAAGGDVFANKGDRGAKTIAQQYQDYGIVLTRAPLDRISGWSEILRRLGDVERDIPPTLKIFNTCSRLINCLPALQHNPNKPEDVKKQDADEEGLNGDDEGDSLRYGLMSRKQWLMRPEGYDSPLGQAMTSEPWT